MQVLGKNWPSTATMTQLLAPLQTDIVLAWGLTIEGAFGGKPRQYGIEQITKLKDSGVLCPDFTLDAHEASHWVGLGNIVLGRRNNHSQGKHIIVVNKQHNTQWMSRSDYWVKAITDVTEEWRIHVLNGWYIGQGRKINTLNDNSIVPIRSRKRGWKIDHNTMPPQFVKDAAKSAVRSIGYDFGAVDVLQTVSGEAVILEVNKAPGLDNYTAARYTRAIERMVNDNSRNSS